MAKTTRYSRAGTTVNVSVPRASYRRASTHRPATRTSVTRTLETVYKPPMTTVLKSSNTPYLIGGVVAAGLLAYLLWPKTAGATVQPGQPGAQGPQGQPGVSAFPQVPGASVGFAGPGMYRYVGTQGLNVRPGPSAASGASLALIPPGTTVQVVADAGNGWFQVTSPIGGFMCASCPDLKTDRGPGGTWLVRQS